MTAPVLVPVLDPDTAQRAFRAVLDALARPGVPAALPPAADVPPALLPVLALADLDTPVCVLGDEPDSAWADGVATTTSAPPAPPGAAPWPWPCCLPPLCRPPRSGRPGSPRLASRSRPAGNRAAAAGLAGRRWRHLPPARASRRRPQRRRG